MTKPAGIKCSVKMLKLHTALNTRPTSQCLYLSARPALDHVRSHIEWQHDSFVEEVSHNLHTFTAGSKRGEDEEEDGRQEADRPGDEDEDKEPDDSPTPLECHCLAEMVLFTSQDRSDSTSDLRKSKQRPWQ